MIRDKQINNRVNVFEKDIIEKLAKIKNLSVTEYMLSCVIPLKLPKNLDEKVKRAIKKQREIKRLDRGFEILKGRSRKFLSRAYTIPNIKSRLFDMMWKGVNHNTIYDYVQEAIRFKGALPKKMVKQERIEWGRLGRLSRVRCGALTKYIQDFKTGGFPKNIIIDLAHNFDYILHVYNLMNSDGNISFERYGEMVLNGDFKEIENFSNIKATYKKHKYL